MQPGSELGRSTRCRNRRTQSGARVRRAGAGVASWAGDAQAWVPVPRDPKPSVDREVVRALVAAGALLLDLHEDVVQEAGRPEPEPIRRHPARTQRLVQDDEVLDGLLGRPD